MPETTAARRTEGQAIAFLAFLGVLLAFAVDVSLPAFDELRTEFGLGEGSGEVSLVITTYLVGVAVGQLVWGPVADRFGRMPALLAGLSLYVVGAAGATAAPSMNTLLVARVVWGFGAASPALLRTTIARDLYDGDRMARIVAATLAVFLIGPAIAPAVGEAILFAGSWRYVFAAPIVVAVGAGIWALRFGETLDPDDRRPLELRSTLRAFRIVARTQASVGYIVAMTLTWGGFFVFLGSGQPIIDEIYGRGDWFAGYFAIASLGMAAASFSASRVTELFGAHRIIRFGLLITIGLSGMMTVAALLTDGRPPFWLWLALVSGTSAGATVATPAFGSLAMQPMARLAGTASAAMGLATMGGGAILAALIDRRIDDSVTPMAVGILGYGCAAFVIAGWARRGSLAPVDPDS